MAKDEVRNREVTLSIDDCIAQEEEMCWAEYRTQQEAEEERARQLYERDMAAYEEGDDDEGDEEVVLEKDRDTRSSRRKSTKHKNKKLKRNAATAEKNLRKRTNDAEAATEQYGKHATAVKRVEKLRVAAEKRGLM